MLSTEAYENGYQLGWQMATNLSTLPLGPLVTARSEAQRRYAQPDTDSHRFTRGVHDGILSGWKRLLRTSVSETRDLSVVIAAMNESRTIAGTLREVSRLNPKEIFVVVNGSTDATEAIARSFHCHVLVYSDPLGHDVGRKIGAQMATARHVLFLDADMVISAENLLPFVRSLEEGAGLVLNNIDPLLPPTSTWDSVSVLKAWLNVILRRPDLGTASMTAIPHGIQRDLLTPDILESLSVPPLAYVRLLTKGTSVAMANSVDVISSNRRRAAHGHSPRSNQIEDLILGDHVEAMEWLRHGH